MLSNDCQKVNFFIFTERSLRMQFLYFDAGLGAMLVQALVAAVAGIALFYKSITYKIKSMFGLHKDAPENEVFDDINVDDTSLENTSKDD